MPLADLISVIPTPIKPVDSGDQQKWEFVQGILGLRLPTDLYDLARFYGSGKFIAGIEQSARLAISILNPFAKDYVNSTHEFCESWRKTSIYDSYQCFPKMPGIFPCGWDDGDVMIFWHTEGEPDSWPLLLTVGDQRWERYDLPLTSFLANVFTGKIRCPFWDYPDLGSTSVKFVTTAETAAAAEAALDADLAAEESDLEEESKQQDEAAEKAEEMLLQLMAKMPKGRSPKMLKNHAASRAAATFIRKIAARDFHAALEQTTKTEDIAKILQEILQHPALRGKLGYGTQRLPGKNYPSKYFYEGHLDGRKGIIKLGIYLNEIGAEWKVERVELYPEDGVLPS